MAETLPATPADLGSVYAEGLATLPDGTYGFDFNLLSFELTANPSPAEGYVGADEYIYDDVSRVAGVLIERPVKIPRKRFGGTPIAPSHKELFYNRVHLDPIDIELGNIVGQVIRQVRVFSAFFTTNELQGVIPSGNDGINDDIVAPYVFGALEDKTYTFEVQVEGSPVIDASYDFIWELDDSRPFVIQGRRLIPFQFPHNWVHEFTEQFTWGTEVMVSVNGTEQRRAVRMLPQVALSTTVLRSDVDAKKLQAMMYGWMNRKFATGFWQYGVILDANYPAGTLVVNFDTTYAPLAVGSFMMFFRTSEEFELVEVLSFTGSAVTLKRETVSDWGVGDKFIPMAVAYPVKKITAKYKTAAVMELPIVWEVGQESYDMSLPDAGTPPATYLGHYLQLEEPDFGDGFSMSLGRSGRKVIDYGSGGRVQDDFYNFTEAYKKVDWLLNGKASIHLFKRFLSDRRGKLRKFFMPTYVEDFKVVSPITNTDTSMIVGNCDYARYHLGRTQFQDMIIFTTSGAVYPRRIVSAEDNGDGTDTIVFSSSLGVNLNPTDIKMVCLLPAWRLDTDTVEFEWITAEVVRVSLPCKVVAP